MLNYQEALSLILQSSKPLEKKEVSLAEALDLVLAEKIKARLPFPHFDNSAVDGFAVRFGKKDRKEFEFKGEVPAGLCLQTFLDPGEAIAVFTGAPVPRGTDTVVMQEYSERKNGSVLFQTAPEAGENIRLSGEDFQKNETLLNEGVLLEPQHLALLAALGLQKVKVIRAPHVAFLSTGNEVVSPGKKLLHGQIYDSNTPLLEALLKRTGACPLPLKKTKDDLSAIRAVIRRGLTQDVLIVCGGVSVGKYDYVKEALRLEGVREIFWKIDIKPGKPVFFGKKGRTLVFGLPGNPVSVYVTFEEFVKPALLQMMGKKSQTRWVEGFLTEEFKNGPRPHFIRVDCLKKKEGYEVTPLKGQGSHQIGALAQANGLLKVEAREHLKSGEKVRVKLMSEVVS